MSDSIPESGFPIFRTWSIYRRIVHQNLMRHREVASSIEQLLAASSHALRVVDAGCGDGQMARHGLRGSAVASYLGIDLSQPALDDARHITFAGEEFAHTQIELCCADLRAGVASLPAQSADVLLASYSLHHLAQSEKRDLLREVGRVLAPQGHFIWADVALGDGQTRLEYLQAMAAHMRREWAPFTDDELDQIVEHIMTSDFPESVAWMCEAAESAGLSLVSEPYRDAFYGVWCFRA